LQTLGEIKMCSVLTAIRIQPELLQELKALARRESERRGEFVSWAKLVRESAVRMLKKATARDQK
jgi:hypothetical protein